MNNNLQLDFSESPKSYWIESTSKTSYSTLDRDLDIDVVIIGGGLAGISCAYQLINEGVKLAILESDSIATGTTGYTTAKITSQHNLIYHKLITTMGQELAKQYADANEFAIREIKRIADANQIQCDYIEQSAYVFTQSDDYIKQIENEVNAASSLGIKANLVHDIPLDFKIKAAVRFDDQAQFHPLKYIHSLADYISKSGGEIYENTRAFEIDDENLIITTEKGYKVKANKIIIASHYPFYNKPGMYYSRIYSERSYVVAVKSKDKYPGGMYINAEEPTRSLRYHETNDGGLILVGGENHKTGQSENTNKHYQNLIDYSHKILDVEGIPYRWSTQDCMTLDGIPYVGYFTSDTPNIFVATGFGKWGMTNSTVSSIIIKDLILEGKSKWQEVYNPSRKTIVASTKNFVSENINVAGQLISGKLSSLPEEISIKPGEGKLIKRNNERVGAYLDKDRKLYLVNTTCTHMGCELNWNSAERSWDCPCHGSRFDFKGAIIEGPATRPLSFDYDVNTFKKLIKEEF